MVFPCGGAFDNLAKASQRKVIFWRIDHTVYHVFHSMSV
jgi:hypothetical protein